MIKWLGWLCKKHQAVQKASRNRCRKEQHSFHCKRRAQALIQPHGSKKITTVEPRSAVTQPNTDLLSFNTDFFSFQERDKSCSTTDANGAGNKIFPSMNKPEKNALVNEASLKQKAFILLCSHRCFERETPQLPHQLQSLICIPCCSKLYNLFTYDRLRSWEAAVLLIRTRDVHLGLVCTCLSPTLAAQLLQVGSVAH